MQHRAKKDWWKEFDSHRDRDMLKRMANSLASRTATTVFVKIKAHTSVPLNETADLLADAVCNRSGMGVLYQHLPPIEYQQQEPVNMIRIKCMEARPTEDGHGQEMVLVEKDDKHLNEHFISRRNTKALAQKTITMDRFCQKGCGRDVFGKALWGGSLTDTNVKRVLQVVGNFFPTQQYLHRIGAATSPNCPYCQQSTQETIQHWQATCDTFHDARTKVHNDIWKNAWKTIVENIDAKEWKPLFETSISDANIPFTDISSGTRQPDGILQNRYMKQWILLDFTRGSGHDVKELQKSSTHKYGKYNNLVSDIVSTNGQDSAYFFPLVTSYSGAILVESWERAFVETKILTKAQLQKVLAVVAQQLCIGIDTMATARARAKRRDKDDMVSQNDAWKHRGNWFTDTAQDPELARP